MTLATFLVSETRNVANVAVGLLLSDRSGSLRDAHHPPVSTTSAVPFYGSRSARIADDVAPSQDDDPLAIGATRASVRPEPHPRRIESGDAPRTIKKVAHHEVL